MTTEQDDGSDEAILKYTQKKRKDFVDKITEHGALPDKQPDRMALLSALDGMDRSSLTRMRIKADEKQTDSAGQANAILARLLTLAVPNKVRSFDPDAVMPTLPNDLPAIELLEGETDIGTQNGNYESFLKDSPKEM